MDRNAITFLLKLILLAIAVTILTGYLSGDIVVGKFYSADPAHSCTGYGIMLKEGK